MPLKWTNCLFLIFFLQFSIFIHPDQSFNKLEAFFFLVKWSMSILTSWLKMNSKVIEELKSKKIADYQLFSSFRRFHFWFSQSKNSPINTLLCYPMSLSQQASLYVAQGIYLSYITSGDGSRGVLPDNVQSPFRTQSLFCELQ